MLIVFYRVIIKLLFRPSINRANLLGVKDIPSIEDYADYHSLFGSISYYELTVLNIKDVCIKNWQEKWQKFIDEYIMQS